MARLVVPGLLAGLATTGLVAGATTTPPSSASAGATAVPTSTPSAPAAVTREQGTSRSSSDRPELTAAAAAKAKAAAKARSAAQQKKKAAATAKAKASAKAKAKLKAKTAKAASLPKVDLPPLKVVDTEYTRVALNVRERADVDSDLITVLSSGSKVSVTATVRGAWQYVAYRGDGGWVRERYLVESKPKPATAPRKSSSSSSSAGAGSDAGGGVSGAACSGGSGVESGLTPDAIRVHRAICARFPGVTSFGGVRADSMPQHPSGRALDAMVSSQGLGQQIAGWVRANAGELGVSEVIFAQRIWTVQRGSEGWRSMSDRGSATANHYDHVHISVYGSSGG